MKGDLAFRLFYFYHLNCGGFPSLQLWAHPVHWGEVDTNTRNRPEQPLLLKGWRRSRTCWHADMLTNLDGELLHMQWQPADRRPQSSPESGDIVCNNDGPRDTKHWPGPESASYLKKRCRINNFHIYNYNLNICNLYIRILQTFIANIQIIYETDHFYTNLTCCLVLTRSRGWKKSVEQVPLKMFHY